MKKILFSAAAFSLVAVSSMALVPTTAEAIPAFARQTGAACLSCHFQTFPAINAFGRAFKKGSFTDVGEQALVEDENLSIPAVLNASVVIRGDFNSTNFGTTGVATSSSWNVPSETPLLIAGRLGTNTGAFVEFGNGGAGADITAAAGTGTATGTIVVNGGSSMGVGNWQLLNSFDVGDFKVGVSAHNSSFGYSAIMETSNVFGQHGGKLFGADLSALQAIGFAANGIGVGAWIGNDLGDIQFSLVAPNAAQGTNVALKFGKLVRAHLNLDVAGFDTMIGFGISTGKAGKPAAVGGVGEHDMNLQFIDFQMQGDLGDTSVGIYGDWAHAKGKTSPTANTNVFGYGTNGVGTKSDGFSIRAEIKPLHNVMLGIGYGYQKFTGVTPATDATTKLFQIAATYEIYQNFEINARYLSTNFGATTDKTTTIEFEGLL